MKLSTKVLTATALSACGLALCAVANSAANSGSYLSAAVSLFLAAPLLVAGAWVWQETDTKRDSTHDPIKPLGSK
ncbi:MAG: hypothetical protein J6M53_05620 [Bacteroidaceae bacterium]|nr:hypothetical protein [Bacteroidaceae bacterium]